MNQNTTPHPNPNMRRPDDRPGLETRQTSNRRNERLQLPRRFIALEARGGGDVGN